MLYGCHGSTPEFCRPTLQTRHCVDYRCAPQATTPVPSPHSVVSKRFKSPFDTFAAFNRGWVVAKLRKLLFFKEGWLSSQASSWGAGNPASIIEEKN